MSLPQMLLWPVILAMSAATAMILIFAVNQEPAPARRESTRRSRR